MHNEIDLQYLQKLIEDNSLFYSSKVDYKMFEDIFAINVYKIIAKNISDKGVFLPRTDFQELVNDTMLIQRYINFKYPIASYTVESIINYLAEYTSKNSFKALDYTINSRYIRSQLKKVDCDLAEDIEDINISSSEILRKYSGRLDNLLYSGDSEKETMSTAEMIEKELLYQSSDEVEKYRITGNKLIDGMNGGLNAPSFTCIVGLPKQGKSVSLYDMAIEMLKDGQSLVFATIEININECYRKILSNFTGIPFMKLNKKSLTKEEKEEYLYKIRDFKERFKDKLFIYYQKNGMSSKEIEVYVKNLQKSGIEIDNVLIDYALIALSNEDIHRTGSSNFYMQIPKEFRILSQKLNTRIFSAAQLGVSADSKDISEISIEDIYFMKNLSQECTYIVIIKKDLDDNLLSRIMLGRQEWNPTVYKYPNYDYGRISLGEAFPHVMCKQTGVQKWENKF